MRFLIDLIRWFISGSAPEAERPSIIETQRVIIPIEPVKKPAPAVFDLKKEADPKAFLLDLQSVQTFTDQFDRAREDLVKELQKLAPPRRFRGVRKDAA